MKIDIRGTTLRVTREEGDTPIKPNMGAIDGNSTLLYHIKNKMNSMGFNLIKKRMHKDGHMVDDLQQYLRVKTRASITPHIYITDSHWNLRESAFKYAEEGECTFMVHYDVFERQPDSFRLTQKLFGYKLWMRCGDREDYKEFATPREAGEYLKLKLAVAPIVKSSKYGLNAMNYQGNNYISAYWCQQASVDLDHPASELTKEEIHIIDEVVRGNGDKAA